MIQDLRPPRAPNELRDRVLRAAESAMGRDTSPSLWDHVWESRSLRLAWGVTMAGLLLAHIALGIPSRPSGVPTNPPSAWRAGGGATEEALRLPKIEISPRAEALAMGGSRRKPARRPAEPDAATKEKNEVQS